MSPDPVAAYSNSLRAEQAEICACLSKAIEDVLSKAVVRIWRSMPVWFIGENPVVGYSVKHAIVTLRFWNGQSFGDPRLTAVGKFRAAQFKYRVVGDVDTKELRSWLRKARTDIWDMVGTRTRMLAPHTWMQ